MSILDFVDLSVSESQTMSSRLNRDATCHSDDGGPGEKLGLPFDTTQNSNRTVSAGSTTFVIYTFGTNDLTINLVTGFYALP